MTSNLWSHPNWSRQPSRVKPFKKRRLGPFGERWRQRHDWERLNTWFTATLARFGRIDPFAHDAVASVKDFPSIGCVKGHILKPYCLSAPFLRLLQKKLAARFPSWRICLTTDVMLADGNVHFVGFDIGANRIANTYWYGRLKFQHLEQWRTERRLLPSPRPARHVPRRPARPFEPPLPAIYEIPGPTRPRNLRDLERECVARRRRIRFATPRHDILWRRLIKPGERATRKRALQFLWRHWRLWRDIDVLSRRIERTLHAAGWSTPRHPRPDREFITIERPFGQKSEVCVSFTTVGQMSPWIVARLRGCLHGRLQDFAVWCWYSHLGLGADEPNFSVTTRRGATVLGGDIEVIRRNFRGDFSWPVGRLPPTSKRARMPRPVATPTWRRRFSSLDLPPRSPIRAWFWDGMRTRPVDANNYFIE